MVATFRAAFCVVVLLSANTALAQSPWPVEPMAEALARLAFEDGLRLLRVGKWVEAEARLRASLELTPRPSASYDLAFVLHKQGRARESADILQRLLAAPAGGSDTRYREYAKTLLPYVLTQLSAQRVAGDTPSADIRIDGEEVSSSRADRSVPRDAGAEIERRVSVGASQVGMAATRASVLPEAALETWPERRVARPLLSPIAPWFAVGLGGALLAGAAVTGVLAKTADDALGGACPTFRNCNSNLTPVRDRAVQLGRVTDALLVSGGVLMAGGITWRILVPAAAPSRAGAQAVLVMASGTY